MPEAADPRIDRAERFVAAPPAEVFAMWADPVAVAAWLPPPGARAEIANFEFRPGGAFVMDLIFEAPTGQEKSGPDRDRVEARFTRIEPPRRVVLEVRFDSDLPDFAGTMEMTWDFVPEGAGTRVSVAARDVPPGIAPEDHQAGLDASLGQLARHAEKHAAA